MPTTEPGGGDLQRERACWVPFQAVHPLEIHRHEGDSLPREHLELWTLLWVMTPLKLPDPAHRLGHVPLTHHRAQRLQRTRWGQRLMELVYPSVSRLQVSWRTAEPNIMLLRDAIPLDAESIGHVRVRAWQAGYRSFLPNEYLDGLDPDQGIDSLRVLLAQRSRDRVFSVVEDSERVVAFSILGSPRYEAGQDAVELWAMNVDPIFWRQGAGRALVKKGIEDAELMERRSIELWCIAENRPARALYESCGLYFAGRERITSNLTGHPLCEVLYRKSLILRRLIL